MTCGACLEFVESILRKQDGIESLSVALLAEQAFIQYLATFWNPEKLAAKIEDIGSQATCESDIRVESALPQESQGLLAVYGMTYFACVASMESAIKAKPGFISCDVALVTEKVKFHFDAKLLGLRDVVERIEDAGFDVIVADDRYSAQLQSLSRVKEIAEWR